MMPGGQTPHDAKWRQPSAAFQGSAQGEKISDSCITARPRPTATAIFLRKRRRSDPPSNRFRPTLRCIL